MVDGKRLPTGARSKDDCGFSYGGADDDDCFVPAFFGCGAVDVGCCRNVAVRFRTVFVGTQLWRFADSVVDYACDPWSTPPAPHE